MLKAYLFEDAKMFDDVLSDLATGMMCVEMSKKTEGMEMLHGGLSIAGSRQKGGKISHD